MHTRIVATLGATLAAVNVGLKAYLPSSPQNLRPNRRPPSGRWCAGLNVYTTRPLSSQQPRMARLLAFVSVFVESSLLDHVVEGLKKVPNVERIYEVTGEFDVVCLVSADDVQEFRQILVNEILKIGGVKSTVTDIVLGLYERQRSDGPAASTWGP